MVATIAAPVVASPRTFADLSEVFQGELLLPGTDGYEAARKVWNSAFNRKPRLIAKPANREDVALAVRYANAVGLAITVKSGGHGYSGAAVGEDALMIDLGLMKGISVQPELRIARAETGLTWAEYQAETGKYGLSTPSGKISSVGLGGVSTGGGIGWLVRKYGMTIDNLLSAEIVTADGDFVTASEIENPDLFWAIRGGGGNFGILTSVEFRLHPTGVVYGGLIAFPVSRASDFLKLYRDLIATAPDELTTMVALFTAPTGHKAIGLGVCYCGPIDEGELTLRPMKEFGGAVMDQLGPLPYGAVLGMVDPMAPAGNPHKIRSGFIKSLDDATIATIVNAFDRAPNDHSLILIEHYGGAASRIDPDATAYTHRNAQLNIIAEIGWHDVVDGYRALEWLSQTWKSFDSLRAGGVYVGFLEGEGPERVREAYGESTFRRLAQVKAKYDPANVFRANQNIPPAK